MKRDHQRSLASILVALAAASAPLSSPSLAQQAPPENTAAPAPTGAAKLRADAEALRPLYSSTLARQFLDGARCLPEAPPRTLYFDTGAKRWITAREADSRDAAGHAALKERTVDFYETKYGSPLAYVRAIDVLASAKLDPAFRGFAGSRVLDFGYGTVGHLKIMSALGARAVGVDVDSMLPALYSERTDFELPEDSDCDHSGSVTLVDGQFPAGPGVADQIGTGYDLFISKNTLKNGYIHPARPVDERMLVHLGIPDEGFLHALFATLNPGGVVIIYNLCPAQAPDDKPYIPWADGRCPFPPALWEKAGFRVIAFDVSDDQNARAMARALGWDKGGMNLDDDLFAWYSVFQKPAR